jgi:hypothetical protein
MVATPKIASPHSRRLIMSTKTMSVLRGMLCCASLLATAPVFADDDPPPPPNRDHDHDHAPRKPPQAAYDACN